MKAIKTWMDGVLILEPEIFRDERGHFFEAFNQTEFNTLTGTDYVFVQDNMSKSRKNVLRGLHYQVTQLQGKLVRAISGAVYDVAVDIRKGSPTFGKYFGLVLSAINGNALWMETGFAHGFFVMSDYAEVLYKTTDYWAPEHERCIIWNDSDLAITWPIRGGPPILSDKDRNGARFKDIELS